MPIRQDTLRLRWLTQQNYATTTRATYTETLRAFERRYPIYAERVTHEHLVDFLTTEPQGTAATRAPSTLDRQRSTLRSFWRWAKRNGYIKTDPSEDLGYLQLGTGEVRPGRWLTRAEAHQLLDSCEPDEQGQRDRTLILLALLTGLRRTELVSLRWRALDLQQGRLTVRGKGGKLATIGVPDQARSALRSWQGTATRLQRRKAPGPDQPVFPTGRPQGGLNNSQTSYAFDWNRPLSPWGVRAMIARRAESAGLGTVATHDLRRSFAGFLDLGGTDLKGIQAALRHSSPEVTARCYLDRSPRRALEAVSNLTL
ncbi:MAG: xerC [Acidimicrobiales bacterium]|nr:xerC [Acidimicrobiales bacterium]